MCKITKRAGQIFGLVNILYELEHPSLPPVGYQPAGLSAHSYRKDTFSSAALSDSPPT